MSGCEVKRWASGVVKMAEGTGFEPAMPLPTYLFSRQAHSTALPPLRRDARVSLRNRTVNKSNSNTCVSETVKRYKFLSDLIWLQRPRRKILVLGSVNLAGRSQVFAGCGGSRLPDSVASGFR